MFGLTVAVLAHLRTATYAENEYHRPQRILPRGLLVISIGPDDLFREATYVFSLQLTATHIIKLRAT